MIKINQSDRVASCTGFLIQTVDMDRKVQAFELYLVELEVRNCLQCVGTLYSTSMDKLNIQKSICRSIVSGASMAKLDAGGYSCFCCPRHCQGSTGSFACIEPTYPPSIELSSPLSLNHAGMRIVYQVDNWSLRNMR